jgi:hypothetical protein
MFLVNPITENEMISEVLKLKDNKSPGYDEINAKIIKTVATDISQLLTHMFNLSFTTDFISEQLKLVLVRDRSLFIPGVIGTEERRKTL